MDVSDGLADGLRQMATASGVGVRVDANAIPVDAEAREWWQARGLEVVGAAVSGGDDYELLFSVPRRRAGALRRPSRGRAILPIESMSLSPVTEVGTEDGGG